jgi:glycosyltransferase involved in cell wall biosynthesis
MTAAHALQLIDGLKIGGAEILLRELSVGLLRRGFRVSIGYSSSGPLVQELTALGLPLTRLPRLMRIDPILFCGMLSLIRRESPQIVHTHLFKSDFHGRLAARISGVPVVVSTLHSIDPWAQERSLGRLYGWTARFADRVIAVSEDVRRFHATHTGIPEEKLVTIENGVDIHRFAGLESVGRAVRKELGFDDAALVFGVVGRLTPPKDHSTFLKAAALILKKAPKARFLIVGDGPLRKDLEIQAQKTGLANAVIFTGLRKDVPALLAALDVLVFSSLWEGLPVALLEGMAAARPIVATTVGGIPEVVLPDKSALLVPPGDAHALAQACLRLASDSATRHSMGQAGLERVVARYGIDAMIDRTAALYAKLLQERGLGQLIPSQVYNG